MRFRFILLFVFLFSCAHNPRSKYEPFSKSNGGYVDLNGFVKDDWRAVQFYGNAHTYHSDVVVLAQLRVIENCMLENMIPTASSEYEIEKDGIIVSNTATSNYQAPSNVSMNSATTVNQFGDNINTQTSGQINHGLSIGSSQTNTQQLNRYNIKMHYKCVSQSFGLGFDTVVGNVPQSIEERLKKSFSMADYLTISKVDRANKGILRIGDIITKVNGEKILNTKGLIDEFVDYNNKTIPLTVFRDGKEINLIANVVDSTNKKREVFNNFIKEKCTLIDEFKSNKLCKK